MKLVFVLSALVFGAFLFGCLGGGQEAAPTPAATAAATATPAATAAATVDVSSANQGVEEALGALGDASNLSGDLDLGDMGSSDLDYVG